MPRECSGPAVEARPDLGGRGDGRRRGLSVYERAPPAEGGAGGSGTPSPRDLNLGKHLTSPAGKGRADGKTCDADRWGPPRAPRAPGAGAGSGNKHEASASPATPPRAEAEPAHPSGSAGLSGPSFPQDGGLFCGAAERRARPTARPPGPVSASKRGPRPTEAATLQRERGGPVGTLGPGSVRSIRDFSGGAEALPAPHVVP